MRRIAVILVGIGMILLGGIWIFKDIYGENIAGTAEDIAVNMVAVKINESLVTGFYDEELDGALLRVERDKDGNIKHVSWDEAFKYTASKLNEIKELGKGPDKEKIKENIQSVVDNLKRKRNMIIRRLYRHVYRLKKAFPAINTKEITEILNKKIKIKKTKNKK